MRHQKAGSNGPVKQSIDRGMRSQSRVTTHSA